MSDPLWYVSFGLRCIALLGLIACKACLYARRCHPVKGGGGRGIGGAEAENPLCHLLFLVFFSLFLKEFTAWDARSPHVATSLVNDNQQFSPEIGTVTVSGPAGGLSFRRRDTSRLWWRVAQLSQTIYVYSCWMRAWGSVGETFKTISTSLILQSHSDILTRMSARLPLIFSHWTLCADEHGILFGSI